MKIKVIIPNASAQFDADVFNMYSQVKDENTELEVCHIAKGSLYLNQRYDEIWSEPSVLLEAEKAEKDGFDGVLVYCALDPARTAMREALHSVNGTFVFDGALIPQVGVLNSPVRCVVKNGVIQSVEGGAAGAKWYEFLKSFDHPQMLRPAHVCYGFHPAAELGGQNGEDERVWGCTEWGFGSIGSFLMPKCGGISAPPQCGCEWYLQ